MIPKKIHYCWFGGKPKPTEVTEYIEHWKYLNPDFKIKEWNEHNFDINIMPFVKQAYLAKKYAFVADVARLYALSEMGGIYLDTDVELIKPFNYDLLKNESFVGFELSRQLMIGTAVIACEKGHKFWKDFYHFYENMNFINPNGSYNNTPNVDYLTERLLQLGCKLNDEEQIINGIHIYPRSVFSPKNYATKRIRCTDKTISIHHFASTWQPLWKRILLRIWVPFSAKFPTLAQKLKQLKR